MMDDNDYHVRVDFSPFCDDERVWAERQAKFAVAKLLVKKLLPNRCFTVRLRQSWNFDTEKAGLEAALTTPMHGCWIQYDIDISTVDEHPAATERPMDAMRRRCENRKHSLRQRIVRAWRVLHGLGP